jgi:outer membrane protein OmpA-like peptidoglycan-associated protein
MAHRSFFLFLLAAAVAFAQRDVSGSKDHPILARYPGSFIRFYEQVDFDKYPLALSVTNNRPAGVKEIEGRLTKITYQNPAGRSSFEIFSNYREALKKAGYQDLFTCEGQACGQAMYWQQLNGLYASGGPREARNLTVRGKSGGHDCTVAISVNTGFTIIHIVEHKAMESGLVAASAAELAEGIDRDGHISVYAIYFDTGRADLKPESNPALVEIARLLATKPTLKLHVVGHTDSTGVFGANMTLSHDRAASVVRALTTDHKVAAARLTSNGVGPLVPVATNTTEEGRAKNRRVDLVGQ